MGILLQKTSTWILHIAQDILEQTEKIFWEVSKNAMQFYIKYRA